MIDCEWEWPWQVTVKCVGHKRNYDKYFTMPFAQISYENDRNPAYLKYHFYCWWFFVLTVNYIGLRPFLPSSHQSEKDWHYPRASSKTLFGIVKTVWLLLIRWVYIPGDTLHSDVKSEQNVHGLKQIFLFLHGSWPIHCDMRTPR